MNTTLDFRLWIFPVIHSFPTLHTLSGSFFLLRKKLAGAGWPQGSIFLEKCLVIVYTTKMDLLLCILAGFLTSLVTSLVAAVTIRTVVNRKTFNFECALGDLQRVVKSLKGADYTQTRWSKKAQEDAQVEALLRANPVRQEPKYDNDWSTGKG